MNMRRLTGFIAFGALLTMAQSCRRVSGEIGGATVAAAGVDTRAANRADTTMVPTGGQTPTPFAPKEPSSPPAAKRWQATADILAGTVIRVKGVAAVTPGPRLAGYRIQPGAKVPLSAEHIGDLVALVRSGSGFDDSVVKRCRPGKSVGFELVRKAPAGDDSTGGPLTQLVLDFGCAKLAVATSGATAEVHTSYFDPSRSAFVAFVKRVLPGDNELRQLK